MTGELTKKDRILDDRHWTDDTYHQRVTSKDWKFLLLNDDDKVIYKGKITQLKGKNIGCGVVEVSKTIT
jgi:hypothetical protein